MNLKVISRNVGYALLVSALFMFLSVLVSWWNGRDSAFAALLISFLITFIFGIFPFIFVRKTASISLKDGYMIIVLSWLLSFVFGMMPYLLWGGPFTVINAWFESVSGFTTTGSTILERVEDLPSSLLFWRSSTHFIGGLGVVVFLLLIIPSSSPVKLRLTNMELSSLSKEGYNVRANKTVSIFTFVYLGLAASAFILYTLEGMRPFDAICHAFSVCATGGFSTHTASIGFFDSTLINVTTILLMFLGSVHFGIIYMALTNRSLRPLNNPVLKTYVFTLVVLSFVVALSLKSSGTALSWGQAFMDATFQVVSYASTSGFAIADNAVWPLLPCLLLLYAGFQCGMAGSTTGGVKTDRLLIFFQTVKRQISRTLRPSSVAKIKVGRHSLSDDEVYPHVLYIALYCALVILSMLFCLMFSPNHGNAVAGVLSSLSNVGPAIGEIGSMGNFNAEPTALKMIYTLDMFLGRIEIYPVLAIFSLAFAPRAK